MLLASWTTEPTYNHLRLFTDHSSTDANVPGRLCSRSRTPRIYASEKLKKASEGMTEGFFAVWFLCLEIVPDEF